MGRDCLPVAMVLITSWRRCIQAVKMKMALDAIRTLILLWKSAQMLTWLRRWVINFAKDQKIFTGSNGMWLLQPSSQYGRRGKGKQIHNPLRAQIKLVSVHSFIVIWPYSEKERKICIQLSLLASCVWTKSFSIKKVRKTHCTNQTLPCSQKQFLWILALGLSLSSFSLLHCPSSFHYITLYW